MRKKLLRRDKHLHQTVRVGSTDSVLPHNKKKSSIMKDSNVAASRSSNRKKLLLNRLNQESLTSYNLITNACHPDNGVNLRRHLQRTQMPLIGDAIGGAMSELGDTICEESAAIAAYGNFVASMAAFASPPQVGATAATLNAGTQLVLHLNCPTNDDSTTFLDLIEDRPTFGELREEIDANEMNNIRIEIDHMASQLENDEIFPYSMSAAETYSRELSILEARFYHHLTFGTVDVFMQIAKAHLMMKAYIVPHSFKISDGCGWKRLESFERARRKAFQELQIIIEEGRSIPLLDRVFMDHDDPRDVDYAAVDRIRDSMHMTDVMNFRSFLLSDVAEDAPACGDFEDVSLRCHCLSENSYCDYETKLCIRGNAVLSNEHSCVSTYNPLYASPHSVLPYDVNENTLLGTIENPGLNYIIQFDIHFPCDTEWNDTEELLSFGEDTLRLASFVWSSSATKPMLRLIDRYDNFHEYLGSLAPSFSCDPTSNPFSPMEIRIIFLPNEVYMWRGDGHRGYLNLPSIHRQQIDTMKIWSEPRRLRHRNVASVRFIRIMNGHKIIDDDQYRSVDYPVLLQPQFHGGRISRVVKIYSPTEKYQISFKITRRFSNLPAWHPECQYYYGSGYCRTGTNTVEEKKELFGLVHPSHQTSCSPCFNIQHNSYSLGVDMSHSSGTHHGRNTFELIHLEPVHVKFVDLGGDKVFFFVNGNRHELDIVEPRLSLPDYFSVHEHGGIRVEVDSVYYQYLTPVNE